MRGTSTGVEVAILSHITRLQSASSHVPLAKCTCSKAKQCSCASIFQSSGNCVCVCLCLCLRVRRQGELVFISLVSVQCLGPMSVSRTPYTSWSLCARHSMAEEEKKNILHSETAPPTSVCASAPGNLGLSQIYNLPAQASAEDEAKSFNAQFFSWQRTSEFCQKHVHGSERKYAAFLDVKRVSRFKGTIRIPQRARLTTSMWHMK